MNTLSAPKNLTRNVLIGMAAGVLFASIFYYTSRFSSENILVAVDKYIFNLGGQSVKNLLMLVVVPLVCYSPDLGLGLPLVKLLGNK